MNISKQGILIHRMELKDLLYFSKVVETGSVTNASKILHRVPSSVSMRIQNLEYSVKSALFLRDKGKMILTPSGKILLEYAHKLLALAEEATLAIHANSPNGILKIGSMESTAATRMPLLVVALKELHPSLSLALSIDSPSSLRHRVLSGDLDAALVPEQISDPRLQSELAYTEELVLVGPHGHTSISSSKDIGRMTLLAFDHDCPFRGLLLDWYRQGGSEPSHVMDLGSYSTILGCCASGIGIALVPLKVVEPYLRKQELSVHPLHGRYRSLNIQLLWRNDIASRNLLALSTLVREQYQRIH